MWGRIAGQVLGVPKDQDEEWPAYAKRRAHTVQPQADKQHCKGWGGAALTQYPKYTGQVARQWNTWPPLALRAWGADHDATAMYSRGLQGEAKPRSESTVAKPERALAPARAWAGELSDCRWHGSSSAGPKLGPALKLVQTADLKARILTLDAKFYAEVRERFQSTGKARGAARLGLSRQGPDLGVSVGRGGLQDDRQPRAPFAAFAWRCSTPCTFGGLGRHLSLGARVSPVLIRKAFELRHGCRSFISPLQDARDPSEGGTVHGRLARHIIGTCVQQVQVRADQAVSDHPGSDCGCDAESGGPTRSAGSGRDLHMRVRSQSRSWKN